MKINLMAMNINTNGEEYKEFVSGENTSVDENQHKELSKDLKLREERLKPLIVNKVKEKDKEETPVESVSEIIEDEKGLTEDKGNKDALDEQKNSEENMPEEQIEENMPEEQISEPMHELHSSVSGIIKDVKGLTEDKGNKDALDEQKTSEENMPEEHTSEPMHELHSNKFNKNQFNKLYETENTQKGEPRIISTRKVTEPIRRGRSKRIISTSRPISVQGLETFNNNNYRLNNLEAQKSPQKDKKHLEYRDKMNGLNIKQRSQQNITETDNAQTQQTNIHYLKQTTPLSLEERDGTIPVVTPLSFDEGTGTDVSREPHKQPTTLQSTTL